MNEGNVLFNNDSKTFYLWLYCIGVKDHLGKEREKKPDVATTWATLSN